MREEEELGPVPKVHFEENWMASGASKPNKE